MQTLHFLDVHGKVAAVATISRDGDLPDVMVVSGKAFIKDPSLSMAEIAGAIEEYVPASLWAVDESDLEVKGTIPHYEAPKEYSAKS